MTWCVINHKNTENITFRVSNKLLFIYGLFKIQLRLYMSATFFGPFSGHHQACHYQNLTKENMTR